MRTQDEILKRIAEVKEDDFFGHQTGDLAGYLEFEKAKPYLNKDYLSTVEKGEKKWEQLTDPKKEISDYLSFAYEKAYSQRGISAGRSMDHYKAWIWLDDPDFYDEIIEMLTNYCNYGTPTLHLIAEHYGLPKVEEEIEEEY